LTQYRIVMDRRQTRCDGKHRAYI